MKFRQFTNRCAKTRKDISGKIFDDKILEAIKENKPDNTDFLMPESEVSSCLQSNENRFCFAGKIGLSVVACITVIAVAFFAVSQGRQLKTAGNQEQSGGKKSIYNSKQYYVDPLYADNSKIAFAESYNSKTQELTFCVIADTEIKSIQITSLTEDSVYPDMENFKITDISETEKIGNRAVFKCRVTDVKKKGFVFKAKGATLINGIESFLTLEFIPTDKTDLSVSTKLDRTNIKVNVCECGSCKISGTDVFEPLSFFHVYDEKDTLGIQKVTGYYTNNDIKHETKEAVLVPTEAVFTPFSTAIKMEYKGNAKGIPSAIYGLELRNAYSEYFNNPYRGYAYSCEEKDGIFIVTVLFPVMLNDRGVYLHLENDHDDIYLDKENQYLESRKKTGYTYCKSDYNKIVNTVKRKRFGVMLEMIDVENRDFIRDLAGGLHNNRFTVLYFSDGKELMFSKFSYVDANDRKVAVFNPSSGKTEIIYKNSDFMIKPEGVSDRDWYEEREIPNYIMESLSGVYDIEDVKAIIGPPSRTETGSIMYGYEDPGAKTYFYRSEKGSYTFIETETRFVLVGNTYPAIFDVLRGKYLKHEFSAAANSSISESKLWYGMSKTEIEGKFGKLSSTLGSVGYYHTSVGFDYLLVFDSTDCLIELIKRENATSAVTLTLKSKPEDTSKTASKKLTSNEIIEKTKYARSLPEIRNILGEPSDKSVMSGPINDSEQFGEIMYDTSDGCRAYFLRTSDSIVGTLRTPIEKSKQSLNASGYYDEFTTHKFMENKLYIN